MTTAPGRSPAVRLLAVLLVLGGCAPVRAAGPSPAAASARVMTFNIFAGNDLERRSNLERVSLLIDSLGADVVFLQEVDRLTARSGGVDQAAEIARRTGLHAVFGRAMDFDGGEYGIAVLTRWPVRASRVVPLDAEPPPGEAPPHEPRTLVHLEAAAPWGVVHLLNTHLDHRPDPAVRQRQMVRLLAYVADAVPPSARVVMGGDLNARPEADEVRALGVRLDDAWARCGAGAGHTFRADRPDRRIDYVMLSGLECTRAWVAEAVISDHRAVVVDVRPAGGR